MKANQKFKSDDEAVSPVIAVILMVAITVVLAATVYVWVSGFKSSGGNAPTLSTSKISFSSGLATYQFTSISDPNVKWGDLEFRIGGVVKAADTDTGYEATESYRNCAAAAAADLIVTTNNVQAGEQFCMGAATGDVLTITHKPTGTVLSTITVS